jgi:hypothetical protein
LVGCARVFEQSIASTCARHVPLVFQRVSDGYVIKRRENNATGLAASLGCTLTLRAVRPGRIGARLRSRKSNFFFSRPSPSSKRTNLQRRFADQMPLLD